MSDLDKRILILALPQLQQQQKLFERWKLRTENYSQQDTDHPTGKYNKIQCNFFNPNWSSLCHILTFVILKLKGINFITIAVDNTNT